MTEQQEKKKEKKEKKKKKKGKTSILGWINNDLVGCTCNLIFDI